MKGFTSRARMGGVLLLVHLSTPLVCSLAVTANPKAANTFQHQHQEQRHHPVVVEHNDEIAQTTSSVSGSPSDTAAEESTPAPPLGRVVPRSSSEIKSSRWSIGLETQDRNYTIWSNYASYVGEWYCMVETGNCMHLHHHSAHVV